MSGGRSTVRVLPYNLKEHSSNFILNICKMVDNVVLINNNFSILEFLREYSLLNGMR